ncbi:hypothetical protein [Micromonospora peucetia]|uniref:Uncharacterized protein n=1 Tax=Micromonospora peucetia TaxID=47871 RepID=A0A1C6UT65_9ACTN|nr:hypothetical protein [Micromonospora peucetia]WSA34791.1 hypothetical protein OIE14_12465 [Micromonospora peucetia]SCL57287.1 hypothetical protein GA0070608_1797 [Micromonospora peucetia]
MDDLTQQLRTAVASSPPTRIDVDRLIADDRRRRHRGRVLAGTGVAAAVAAAVVTPALIAGPAADPDGFALPPAATGSPSADASLCPVVEPDPSGPPAPQQSYDTVRDRPTERPDAGVARLTLVLRPALAAVVPAGLTVDGTIPGCDRVQFTYEKSHWHYYAHARLRGNGQADNVTVTLIPTAADEPVGCAATPDPGRCTGSSQLPDGSSLAVGATRPGKEGHERRWAQVRRADGTTVTVTTDNHHITRGENGATPTVRFGPPPVLTVAQLTAIATMSGLTLYP